MLKSAFFLIKGGDVSFAKQAKFLSEKRVREREALRALYPSPLTVKSFPAQSFLQNL